MHSARYRRRHDAASNAPETPQTAAEMPANADSRPEPAQGPEGPETALWQALVNAPPQGLPAWVLIGTSGMGRTWVYERLREWADHGSIVQVRHGQWRTVSPYWHDGA